MLRIAFLILSLTFFKQVALAGEILVADLEFQPGTPRLSAQSALDVQDARALTTALALMTSVRFVFDAPQSVLADQLDATRTLLGLDLAQDRIQTRQLPNQPAGKIAVLIDTPLQPEKGCPWRVTLNTQGGLRLKVPLAHDQVLLLSPKLAVDFELHRRVPHHQITFRKRSSQDAVLFDPNRLEEGEVGLLVSGTPIPKLRNVGDTPQSSRPGNSWLCKISLRDTR